MPKEINKSNLYTGRGDPSYIDKKIKGTTSLYGGLRRPKNDLIFYVLGQIDSCNSSIGLLAANLDNRDREANIFGLTIKSSHTSNTYSEIYSLLRDIQGKLQTIASHIASNSDKNKNKYSICESDVKYIENKIDFYDKKCPKLTAFILPGSGPLDAIAHISRSEVRNLERKIYLLNEEQEGAIIEVKIFTYINRLSDLLFALARYFVVNEGLKDVVME
jgi:cob(I)alamin adenosyltransferase